MKKTVLPLLLGLALLAGCSTAYKTGQTPDDVYYSPGKPKTEAYAKTQQRQDRYDDRYNRRDEDEYEDYTSSSEDNYLRMKARNRYEWNSLDDYDYWYSPNYAYNNYYGFNSFNPYLLNSWGLSYYYSPFASIQPYGWFNNFYPSYGYGYGLSPYYGGYYGHTAGYGYYGYTPVIVTSNRARASRPLLGGYTNNTYNNSNFRNGNSGGRFIPGGNGIGRYNNNNNLNRFNNANNNTPRFNNNTINNNNNNYTPPVRSYTPSSSGSSGGGGSVSRPVRH